MLNIMKSHKIFIISAILFIVIILCLVVYFKFYQPLNPALGPVKGDITQLILGP